VTEEAKAINSIFKWYRDARVCVTYLSNVRRPGPPGYYHQGGVADQDMEKKAQLLSVLDRVFDRFDRGDGEPSEWFSRGWTLQELLVPRDM
jgi:hypothetical protein